MARNDERYMAELEERRRKREAIEAAAKAEKRKKTLVTVVVAVLCLALVAGLFLLILRPWEEKTTFTTGTGTESGTESTASSARDMSAIYADYDFKHDMTKHHFVEIDVKDYGVIKVELDPTYAPITVDNFLCLAESGFYDGLTFHRIMRGFMIQGGDPNHNGTGGSEKQIIGEFSENGINNPLSHDRGVISMARASYSMDSASSQFFICDSGNYKASLDGKYASFGWVTEGMDVVDAIAAAAQPTDSNGTITYSEQPVINSVKIIEG